MISPCEPGATAFREELSTAMMCSPSTPKLVTRYNAHEPVLDHQSSKQRPCAFMATRTRTPPGMCPKMKLKSGSAAIRSIDLNGCCTMETYSTIHHAQRSNL